MIKRFLRNIILKENASSEKFISYLKEKGVQVGANVRFYSPPNTLVDLSCPWLLSIGDNVNITHGVIILTHDYSWSVLKKQPKTKGVILGAQSPVKIGNNVFIGMNSVITRGVTIGDNVIIGAGSVVTGDCESDSVYVGVPAKRIMSVDDYYSKRASEQFKEAKKMALIYRDKFGENPPKEVFLEYFMLFSTAEEACAVPEFRSQLETGGNFEESFLYMKEHKPLFKNYEDFLEKCFAED